MEHGPTDMIVRYKKLADSEKRRLENDEDRLLVTVLYNMSAFMIMMDVIPNVIRRKVRRMLGKDRFKHKYSLKTNQLQGAGYKTSLLVVYKTSLFSTGPKWLVIRPHSFFEVPKWLSIKPYFFVVKICKRFFFQIWLTIRPHNFRKIIACYQMREVQM